MKVLLTGSSGFLGRGVLERLVRDGIHTVIAGARAPLNNLPEGIETRFFNLDRDQLNRDFLEDIDVIIHTAARVHVMKDVATNPITEYRHINVQGTMKLAQMAHLSGVKRFIFISSIKVNGDFSAPGHPFKEIDEPAPCDPYGASKYEAEQALLTLSKTSNMDVVIIRPPLIYGKGVKANFHSLMNWSNRDIPLPFGSINNKRSLVFLDNIVDLIVTCIDHVSASNQIFLVSDDNDLSTTELIKIMQKALHKRSPTLLPVPVYFLRALGNIFGQKQKTDRLLGNLQVDISKTKKLLGWTPPVTVQDAVGKTASHYLDTLKK